MAAEHMVDVEVLTPEGEVWSGEARQVSTRTEVGEIGILANHAPVLAALRPTELRLHLSDSETKRYAQAHGDYARLHTATGSHLVRVPLSVLEERWADSGFIRIHRRFLVNLSCVRAVERGPKGELSLIMESTAHEAVPVSRRNVPAVRRALGL